MSKDLHSDVPHHALAEKTGEPGLGVRKNELGEQRDEEERSTKQHDTYVAGWYRNINHPSRKQRTYDLNATFDAEQRKSSIHQPTVRTRINKQTTHQLAVVCFAEYVVFVRVGCRRSHSGVS